MSTIASQNAQVTDSRCLFFMHREYSGHIFQSNKTLTKFKINSMRIVKNTIFEVTLILVSSVHHTSRLITHFVVLNLRYNKDTYF